MPHLFFPTNVHFLRGLLIFIFIFIEHENNHAAGNPCNICLNVLNERFYINKTLEFNLRKVLLDLGPGGQLLEKVLPSPLNDSSDLRIMACLEEEKSPRLLLLFRSGP